MPCNAPHIGVAADLWGEMLRAKLDAALNAEPDKKKALEDMFWALLNTREFMFNH